MSDAQWAIEADNIHKTFGSVVANRGARLQVRTGEIHALVGENGAGKSTLMRILSGMYPPDDGIVRIDGRDVTGWDTATAIDAGVGMVHQHFMLVPTLTVAENVVLGRETRNGMRLDRAQAEAAVAALVERTGLHVSPTARVSDLTVGEAQRVEIIKTLYQGARILILDEPTAVLSPPEVNDLWRVLRQLQSNGTTVILITHKLDEVVSISETITVMRQGETVQRMPTAETTPAAIARAMVGRDVLLPAHSGKVAATGTAALLRIRELNVASATGTPAVQQLDLEVRGGEIFGIAGVEGNGQTELIEAIAGLRPVSAGTITIADTDVTNASVLQRFIAGLAHVPEDRHARGLILDYSIADNLLLGFQQKFSRGGVIARDELGKFAEERVQLFDVRPANTALAARGLSGGNQQKVVIAREFARDFKVLLAAQPTRGVDVGAIEMIHTQLRSARDAGKAVLVVSADLVEVLALADRIGVMYRGHIVAVIPREEASEELLGEYMTGVRTA
jgi:general nucleoside transport system ATP-binding protein